MGIFSELINTAEFAKTCNVSKQTLIYYDKINLFKPKHVDNKGYRYYSIFQLEEFYIIDVLKESGKKLAEIKEYSRTKNPANFIRQLTLQQGKISTKIAELKELNKIITDRKAMTELGIEIYNNFTPEIEIIEQKEEILSISNQINDYHEDDGIQEENNLLQLLKNSSDKIRCIGGIITKEHLIANSFKLLDYLFIRTNKSRGSTMIKPHGTYAVAYHKGQYTDLWKTYTKIITFLKVHNYSIVGNSYKDFLLDYCTLPDEEDCVAKISIQVKTLVDK